MAGLDIQAPDVRITGLEFRTLGAAIKPNHTAHRLVVDHSLFYGGYWQIWPTANIPSGGAAQYATDIVIEHNRFADSNLWQSPGSTNDGSHIPWRFIKDYIRNANGADYATNRIGESSETTALRGRGGSRRTVFRYNVVDGYFDGGGPGYNDGYDRYAGADLDMHDNTFRHIADDALEVDGNNINVRIWNNRVEHVSSLFSTSPSKYGPVYFFRNTVWRVGNDGVGQFPYGNPQPGPSGLKYGESVPPALIYVVHNTFWTDSNTPSNVSGWANYGGAGANPPRMYVRNNLYQVTGDGFSWSRANSATTTNWDEDYNYFFTTHATKGVQYGGAAYTSVAAYRAASGQGAHSNTAGDFRTSIPTFVNAGVGDLHLVAGSPLIDAGTPIPNLSDLPGVNFGGAAPDLGASEN
jgi:hypothetical protein